MISFELMHPYKTLKVPQIVKVKQITITNIWHSTPISTFDALSKWHKPDINLTDWKANKNVFHFLRIYLPKKPHAHIVCLALLMNQNMLQPFLIVIRCIVWNAKFHVTLLQVHSVLVTTNMMQFYIRWFYQNMPVWHQFYDYDLFVMFQEREQYMFLFRLFFTVPITVTRLRV